MQNKLNVQVIRVFFILIIISMLLAGCSVLNSDSNKSQNISDSDKSNMDAIINQNNSNENKSEEKQIANFSTPLTSGSPNRIVNIKLTCNKLNEYVLRDGETFSFNQIVGPCTAEEGYLKSEIFVNGKIEYALGGGNCQVSTTLYNACLQVDGITILERHEHGRDVDYIEDGKDAAVSYNTVDYSFRNDTGFDIKLLTSCDDINVYASINRIN